MSQLIISIGREFGSGGREIGTHLAEHYGLPLYDQNILTEIAEEKNVSSAEIAEFDEVKRNKFLYRTVRGMNSSPQDNLAQLQFDFLKEKAASGESFIVVGRCSETILRDNPAMISVFINGDMDAKVERITKLYKMSEKEAEKFIKDKNHKRKKYHNSHCDSVWGDSRNYDLTINSSKLGVAGSVDILVQYIDARRKITE